MNKLIIKDLIKSQVRNRADLALFKRKIAKKYEIPCPSNIQLLKAYHASLKNKRFKRIRRIEQLLKTRPVRSLSGIVNVSVLTKPYPCPGKCIYCPLEKGIPKSYLSQEPAVERAKALKFNPYLQVKKRLEMLKEGGHPTDKIELRVIGATWSYYPQSYQNLFIKRCFEAANGKRSKSLLGAQKRNEKSKQRITGLSIETRPDFVDEKEIKQLRKLGVTKVELGVQSTNDHILKLNKRGHGVKETTKATKALKEAGFKVSYQIMLNLPGSTPRKDILMGKELFSSPDFKPDSLKIYPCALLKEAPLYKWYLKGKYNPYSKKKLIEVIKKIKKEVPYYVRIERIIRDIPSQKIVKGPTKITNLRQVVREEIKKEGWQCQCIRCKEIKAQYDPREKIYLFRKDYEASEGQEIFLSFENKKRTHLYSILRLRISSDDSKNYPFSLLQDSSLIREIHTYGQLVPISKKKIAAQHKGLGKKLIKEAEKITKRDFGLKKIAAISAIGARQYYRKLGYRLKDTYMVKYLK